MRLIGGFFEFTQRVLEAARSGRLSKEDNKKLERLFERTAKRNTVLAKGLLAALNVGGAKEKDIKRFSELLEKANQRIENDQEPFTLSEKKEISEIFKRAYLSDRAAKWFSSQIDELLAEEIEEYIKGKRFLAVPSKKTVTFEKPKTAMKI